VAATDVVSRFGSRVLGAITGNETMKREGQRQEDKGKVKRRVDSTIGKTQDALNDLKGKLDRK
jgi:uncharacterized protein YjbJ (UPF0337 family)